MKTNKFDLFVFYVKRIIMDVREILNNNDFVFKKKFGQNFLIDQNILNNIVSLADITKDTLVIEIGVGAGALTKKLSEASGKVLAYEIDTTLKEPLSKILENCKNVDIIFDDFLKREVKEDIKKYNYNKLMVVANLPYYITTPIITKFIDENVDVEKIIVMVQNEVADRFSSKPGSKSYNSLTIFLNYHFNIKKAFVVPKNVFYPKPNVDSAVVVFSKKIEKLSLNDKDHFFELVRKAFVQKRKTLKNNLSTYDLNKINEVLKAHNKDITFRAETITIQEFVEISNELTKH